MDRFDEVAAKILKDLYRNFPDPHHPTPETTGLTEERPEYVNGESNASEKYKELAKELRSAMNWLVDEDYIYDRGYKFGPSHVLTGKGLKALQRVAPEFQSPAISE